MGAPVLSFHRRTARFVSGVIAGVCCTAFALAAASAAEPMGAGTEVFPLPLDAYADAGITGVGNILRHRATAEPFNLVATLIFMLAIVHTFLAPRFMKIAHRWRDEHDAAIRKRRGTSKMRSQDDVVQEVSLKAEVMHFFGEVEAIFGIWVVPLLLAITFYHGWPAAEHYISHGVDFTEPMFVVVVMTIAATRPVLRFAEWFMSLVPVLSGRKPAAWWLSILTIGPILGSFITEPAAMTICALLLARQFYDLKPSRKFCYATLGLLFVNVSVGGTLTHFAAPPVLMVAARWSWDTPFMFAHFGWKAVIGIFVANAVYFAAFRREFERLCSPEPTNDLSENWQRSRRSGTRAGDDRASIFSRLDRLHRAHPFAFHRRLSVLPRLRHRHRTPPESAQSQAGVARRIFPRRRRHSRRAPGLVDCPSAREHADSPADIWRDDADSFQRQRCHHLSRQPWSRISVTHSSMRWSPGPSPAAA